MNEPQASPNQADEMKAMQAKAQVMHDLHDALGVRWGDNPYARIEALKAAERQRDRLVEELRRLQDVVAPEDFEAIHQLLAEVGKGEG